MLSNRDLKYLAKQYNVPLDYVGYKDAMPKAKNRVNYSAIINLDGKNPDDFNKNGSHWTCLVMRDKFCAYFDPFGLPESKATTAYIRTQNIKSYSYNSVKIQDIKDDHCGWYCIAFLMFVRDNYKRTGNDDDNEDCLDKCAVDFTKLFDSTNSTHNKDILKKTFFYNY